MWGGGRGVKAPRQSGDAPASIASTCTGPRSGRSPALSLFLVRAVSVDLLMACLASCHKACPSGGAWAGASHAPAPSFLPAANISGRLRLRRIGAESQAGAGVSAAAAAAAAVAGPTAVMPRGGLDWAALYAHLSFAAAPRVEAEEALAHCKWEAAEGTLSQQQLWERIRDEARDVAAEGAHRCWCPRARVYWRRGMRPAPGMSICCSGGELGSNRMRTNRILPRRLWFASSYAISQ